MEKKAIVNSGCLDSWINRSGKAQMGSHPSRLESNLVPTHHRSRLVAWKAPIISAPDLMRPFK
jgi:hypothetical protein